MTVGQETFDVVVVGVTDAGRGHEPSIATELAARCRLPVANVKVALNQGELLVHRGVEGQLAQRLQAQLRDLGANAVARPSEESLESLVIEADPEDVPELISAQFDAPESRFDLPEPPLTRDSPISPPPDFGGRSPAASAPAVQRPPLDPSRPQGRGASRPERPFATPEDARTQRFASVPSGGRRPAAKEIEDLDAPTQRYEPVPTQRRGLRPRPHDPRVEPPVEAEPTPRASQSAAGNALDDLVGTLEAAAASGGSFGVVTLDGIDHADAPERPKPSSTSSSAPEERAQLVEEEGVSVPQSKAARQGPAPESSLQLERMGTPVAGAPAGPSASGSGMARPSASMAGASTSGFRPQYAGTSGGYAQAPPLGDLDGPRNLFVSDTVTNYLVGVTLGLIVGLVVGLATRGSFREGIQQREDELASSFIRPLEVAAGDLRAPQAILSELDELYSEAQRGFLLRMFLVGIPLGLGVGRIRLG